MLEKLKDLKLWAALLGAVLAILGSALGWGSNAIFAGILAVLGAIAGRSFEVSEAKKAEAIREAARDIAAGSAKINSSGDLRVSLEKREKNPYKDS